MPVSHPSSDLPESAGYLILPKPYRDKLLKLEGDTPWFWHQHAPAYDVKHKLLYLFNNDNFRAQAFQLSQSRSLLAGYGLMIRKEALTGLMVPGA